MSRLRRKVTRHKVNEPLVDKALSDLYNEIDKLQATTPSSIASSQENQPGDVAIIETSDGTTTIGVNTENGWMADVNAVFTPIANKSFITSLGTKGMSGKPLPHESVKYNKDSKAVIVGPDSTLIELSVEKENLNIKTNTLKLENKTGDKVLIKNEGAILKVRNAADNADAQINASKLVVSAEAAATNEIGKSNVSNKFLSTHDGSALYNTLMMNSSGVVENNPAGGNVIFVDDRFLFADNADNTKTCFFQLSGITSGAGRTLTIPDADGTIALTSDVVTNHITNNAADVMTVSDFGANAALKIDADQPATPLAENSSGLHIDYDRIVAASGTAVHNDIGIDLDINTASLGTSFTRGMDIDVVGATSGTHTVKGIDIRVSGADKNHGLDITAPDGANDYHIKLIAADDILGDYATLSVANTGDMTIATEGNGTTDSDLTLDVDGKITLDSANGQFVASNNGTEFSVANSAYAGMIVGYTCIQNTDAIAGDDVITIGTTMTVLQTVNGTDVSVTFKAPPSGNVEIMFSAMVYGVSKEVLFALSDNATFNEVSPIHTYDAWSHKMDETDQNQVHIPFVLTGLTPGSAYTYFVGADASGASAYIYHGSTRTNLHSPPITMKATALPGTIGTGT